MYKSDADLFDMGILDADEGRKRLFDQLIKIRSKSQAANLTDTHRLLAILQNNGKLRRCYTQNIDGLDVRAGLNADLDSPGCTLVQLHGNLETLRCTLCNHHTDWADVSETALRSGDKGTCPHCQSRLRDRAQNGERLITVGTLRPNVVLLREWDPVGEIKGEIIRKDAKSKARLVVDLRYFADRRRSEANHESIVAGSAREPWERPLYQQSASPGSIPRINR